MRTLVGILWLSTLLSCRAVLEEEWQQWKVLYGKVYPSAAHEARARDVWLRRMDFIFAHNSRTDVTFTLGMNEFGDQMLCSRESGPRSQDHDLSHTLRYTPKVTNNFLPRAPPTSFDWRNRGAITPVKNQGQVGSAEAYAITEDLESYHAIKTGQLVSLSVQEVVDCCLPEPHLAIPNIYECISRHGGLCSEQSYPPGPGTQRCRNDSCTAVADDAKVTVHIPRGDEEAMLTAVLQRPLVVYIDASRQSFRMYQTGVYSDTSCTDMLDHALQLVGYGVQDGVSYWILKNSWGASWGMQGYVLLRRGVNMCGVADMALYPQ